MSSTSTIRAISTSSARACRRRNTCALVAGLRAEFGRDARGQAQRIDHPGYGVTDAFFTGTGRYLPWMTCNEWVRRLIARAGVRTAAWAPFEPALLWHARRVASD